MPHRGPSVCLLAKRMQNPIAAIFNDFRVAGFLNPMMFDGSAMLKYHLARPSAVNIDGNTVHLSLDANPSHLEP